MPPRPCATPPATQPVAQPGATQAEARAQAQAEAAMRAALARIPDAWPGFSAEVGREAFARARRAGGALTTAELARDPDAAIAAEAARAPSAYGAELRPDVAAAFALHRHLQPVALLFTLPWLTARVVPELPPGRAAFDPVALRLAAAPTRLLTDAGPEAVRAALRAHLAPLLAAFRPRMRRGPHTLWALALDDAVEGLHHVADRTGLGTEARAALNLLFPGGTSPFPGAAGFGPAAERARVSCCLFYTVPGARPCAGCPRLAPGRRGELLHSGAAHRS